LLKEKNKKVLESKIKNISKRKINEYDENILLIHRRLYL